MTLRYNSGLTFDAVLLSREETRMRVCLKGSDDVLELNQIAGTWVTDDCEPVQVEYSWSGQYPGEPLQEEHFTCSHDLAAHLIHLLYAGEEEPAAASAPIHPAGIATLLREVS
jgi:hypothetical protein